MELESSEPEIIRMIDEGSPVYPPVKLGRIIRVKEMPTKEVLEDFIRQFFGLKSKARRPVIFNIETGRLER